MEIRVSSMGILTESEDRSQQEDTKKSLTNFLFARYAKAYGYMITSTIQIILAGFAWVVESLNTLGVRSSSPMGEDGEKRMYVGERKAGETWVDLNTVSGMTRYQSDDGHATFPVNGAIVWAYLPKE